MRRWLFIALLSLPQISIAQKVIDTQPGMVITGDREAPLVLYIVPWQEPAPMLAPEVQVRILPPQVVDYDPGPLEAAAIRAPGSEVRPPAR